MRPPKQRRTGREIETALGSGRGNYTARFAFIGTLENVEVDREPAKRSSGDRGTPGERSRPARLSIEWPYCDELGVATSTRSSASSCASPSWRRATSPAPPSDDETPT